MNEQVAGTLERAGMSEAAAREKVALFRAVEAEVPAGLFRWFVPGRIQLLGGETRSSGGRSLVCAAERGYCVSATPRSDTFVRIKDVAKGQSFMLQISSNQSAACFQPGSSPANLVRRVAHDFPALRRGADISLASDLPSSTGMGSSGALMTAVASALCAVNGLIEGDGALAGLRPEDLAGYLACVENGEKHGAGCGDDGCSDGKGGQKYAAILLSEAGQLKQIASPPIRVEAAAKLPVECVFAIAASGLTYGEIERRRAWNALEDLGSVQVASGTSREPASHQSSHTPDRYRTAPQPDARDSTQDGRQRRSEESALKSSLMLQEATAAIAGGDLDRFGGLVDELQASSEGPTKPPRQAVLVAQLARSLGAYAAAAFGAGGSAWALVARAEAEQFVQRWRKAHMGLPRPETSITQFFLTQAGPGMVSL